MNIDQKLKATVVPFLDPQERIQAVAAGQTVEPFILANAAGVGVIAALGLWQSIAAVTIVASFGLLAQLLVVAVIFAIPVASVLMFTRFRILTVTNRRIVLLRSGMLRRHRAKGIVGQAARDTKLLKSRESVSVKLALIGRKQPTTIYVRHAALAPLQKSDDLLANSVDLHA